MSLDVKFRMNNNFSNNSLYKLNAEQDRINNISPDKNLQRNSEQTIYKINRNEMIENIKTNDKSKEESKKKWETDELSVLDKLSSYTFVNIEYKQLRSFLTRPIQKGEKMVCNIERKRTGEDKSYPRFLFTLNKHEKFLLAAKKMPGNTSSNYIISMAENSFDKKDENFLGKLRANFMSTEYYIYDTGVNPANTKIMTEVRREYGAIQYQSTGIFGTGKQRKMIVYIPEIENGEFLDFRPMTKNDSIICKTQSDYSKKNIQRFGNFEETSKNLFEDNARSTLNSTKNFRLGKISQNEVVSKIPALSLGKLKEDIFSCDFEYPFSPLLAFAISLSSIDK